MIDVRDLSVSRQGRTICSVPSLSVSARERIAILGANGSGKTTLLRVLAGLETEFVGRCAVQATRRECVFVHQSPYMFRGSVLSNVTYGLRARGVKRAERDTMALDCLERLGLENMIDTLASHLSGGEKRRVALARAAVLRPRLLLLDEPLAEMDQAGMAAVAAVIAGLSECTVLMASPVAVPNDLATTTYAMQVSHSVGAATAMS